MYPPFLKESQDEEVKPAEFSVRFALGVQDVHHGLYQEALAAVKASQDLPERKVYVWAVCGNTVYDDVPDPCSICNSPASRFSEVA
jgi:rubrerythrin